MAIVIYASFAFQVGAGFATYGIATVLHNWKAADVGRAHRDDDGRKLEVQPRRAAASWRRVNQLHDKPINNGEMP